MLSPAARDASPRGQHFISSGYGLVASVEEGNRKAVWSIRQARKEQNIYYQAVVRAVRTKAPRIEEEAPEVTSSGFEGPRLEAAKSLIAEIQAKSADTQSFVAELIKRLNQAEPGDNVKLLLGPKPTLPTKVEVAVRLLAQASIPARVVQGIRLQEEKHDFQRKPICSIGWRFTIRSSGSRSIRCVAKRLCRMTGSAGGADRRTWCTWKAEASSMWWSR
jgi:hypothetical protein